MELWVRSQPHCFQKMTLLSFLRSPEHFLEGLYSSYWYAPADSPWRVLCVEVCSFQQEMVAGGSLGQKLGISPQNCECCRLWGNPDPQSCPFFLLLVEEAEKRNQSQKGKQLQS